MRKLAILTWELGLNSGQYNMRQKVNFKDKKYRAKTSSSVLRTKWNRSVKAATKYCRI